MHEFSIVQSLISLIEKYASEEGAKSVTRVVLQIGPLSGVEPHLLEVAFNTFKEGTVANQAVLEIERTDLAIYCDSCGKEYSKKELNILCPVCGSYGRVVKGDELILKSLEMDV
ncbi:hydrogenase maturation nickel metallochaperone HypA [Thermocrinis minervae]|uniref:Hydrogenase maturation factor HypA n=1 Tax=Thermocrinis minervae TaxID=381751 RepID=A0A1M6S9E8_9AQUI|nr:hydrogenase maturation nickel metallochaperone HypA [Thermocrinis minervae]SHK41266.1 Hydrogenase-3 nickel incorporation protein HypA [Thermocrinis minervae]